MKNYLSVVLIDKIPVKLFVFHIIISGKITPVPEIIDPVFAKTSQNARFLLSENEHFGLVFVKTGSINSGTGLLRRSELNRPPALGPTGLRSVAREEDNTQAVFSSPLILPGQFFDYPELPEDPFLGQFSRTLNAAERPSNRHNTTATEAARHPCPRTKSVRLVALTCPIPPAAL
jgi:hypothetical protein